MDDLPSGTGKHERIPLKVGVLTSTDRHFTLRYTVFLSAFFILANKSRATHRNNGHKMCFLFFFFLKKERAACSIGCFAGMIVARHRFQPGLAPALTHIPAQPSPISVSKVDEELTVVFLSHDR